MCRRERDLRIDRGTGAADRRLRMAAAATIEIQRRAKSLGDLLRLLELLLAGQEVFVLVIGDAGERPAGGAGPAAHARILGARDATGLRRDRLPSKVDEPDRCERQQEGQRSHERRTFHDVSQSSSVLLHGFSSALSWIDGDRVGHEHTSGVVTCWQDSIVATGQTDPRGDRVNRRDRPLQSCRRSAVLGKRPLAPQASCLFRIRSKTVRARKIARSFAGLRRACRLRLRNETVNDVILTENR